MGDSGGSAEHRDACRMVITTPSAKGWVLNRRAIGPGPLRGQLTRVGSELVHLGSRRGHATRAGPEVRVHGNRPADRDDPAESMAVMRNTVTHCEHLVRRDRVPGGIEGAGRQAAALRRRGHAPIILLLITFR